MASPDKGIDGVTGGRKALLSISDVILIESGLPIVVAGKIIGAVGVSEGSSSRRPSCQGWATNIEIAREHSQRPTVPTF